LYMWFFEETGDCDPAMTEYAKVEINDDRAIFLSKGLDQGNGETGKGGAGQGHELAEKRPFQPEIKQYADADDHHGNAGDFRPG